LNRELIGWALDFCRSANKGHVERAAPLLRDLHLASRACYEEFARRFGDFGLTQNGLLMICNTLAALHEEAELAKMACRLGLDGQLLTAEETAKVDPGIRMEVAGAVYYPQDSRLIPQKFMSELTTATQAAGADIHWSTEVTSWRWKEGKVEAAKTSGSEFHADEFIIACGSWSSEIVRHLGVKLPMQPGKGYSLTISKPRQTPKLGSILMEARVAVTPMGEDLRFAGTMEIAGMDHSVNSRRVDGIIKSVCRYFPDFHPDDFIDAPVWAGLRPCSPDGLPYIGRFTRYPNLIAASGHAMMGLSLGPITGKLVSEMLCGEPASIPLEYLSPDRFSRSRAAYSFWPI
jgi:D-amino-acid dehydrogenase